MKTQCKGIYACKRTRLALRGIAASLIFSLLLPAYGQTPAMTEATDTIAGVTVSDGGNRVSYGPEYFQRYNVITAADQIERIPGIQDLLGGGGFDGNNRGFGNSGDQVLINGKRLSGKSNDIGSTLGRIQARQVVRIEVIRGTVDDLDVRSQGRVVNVVLNDTLNTSYGSWEGSLSHYSDGRVAPGAELNYAGDFGALNYLFSAEFDPARGRDEQTDNFFTASGDLFEKQVEVNPEASDEYEITGNTTYTFGNGDILNLNLLYASEDESASLYSDRFIVTPGSTRFDRSVLITNEDLSSNWEIGGDYEHVFSNGNIGRLLFVMNAFDSEETSTLSTMDSAGNTLPGETQEDDGKFTENILRTTYQWGFTDTRSLESGVELAVNTQESDIRLLEDNGGILQEIPLFNQESEVKEERLEAFTTVTWQVRNNLLLEASLDAEYSELSQEGRDISRTRDFFFLRPRLVARYDLTPSTQIRAQVVRTVNQLDFGAFTASFSNDDNRRDVISAGNPELVPEQAWEYELTLEHRLPEDLGLLSATASLDDIEDRQARVPLVVVDENGIVEEFTAPGNIGDAWSAQFEANASLRLGWLGLNRALVEVSVQFTETEVTDPFTGEERDFNWVSPWEWSLGFRHDMRWKNFSYGISTWQQAENQQFDRDFQQTGLQDPDLEIFAEMQPVENLTLRLSVEEVLRAESRRERYQYVGNRGDGVLERRELRNVRPVREITFSVQGVF